MNILRYFLVLCLVFIQSGYTYYVSFQVLALLILILVIIWNGASFKISLFGIFSIFIFISFIVYTGIDSPLIISPKSSNFFLTVMALVVYSLMIYSLSLIHIKRNINSLLFLCQITSSVISVLFVVLVFSELDFIPFLTRQTLAMQNTGLIDNLTSIKDIELSIKMDQFRPKVDLFYGEPSYLAIVIFTCLGGFVLANKGLEAFGAECLAETKASHFNRQFIFIIVIGVAILVYIQSLSSIIYAIITVYYALIPKNSSRKKHLRIYILYYVFLVLTVIFSWEYFAYRVNMSSSISFIQRFGFIFEMTLNDFIYGVRDISKLPKYGIHNGVIFLIVISGIGGMTYLLYLLRYAYKTAAVTGLAMYSVLLILGIFMQNGGIFTPGKIVLISLVMLPLASLRNASLAYYDIKIDN